MSLVSLFIFRSDALEQLLCSFQLIRVLRAPLGSEFPLERMLQQRLAVYHQLLMRRRETFDAGIQLGEQFLQLGDDTALLVYGRKRNG